MSHVFTLREGEKNQKRVIFPLARSVRSLVSGETRGNSGERIRSPLVPPWHKGQTGVFL